MKKGRYSNHPDCWWWGNPLHAACHLSFWHDTPEYLACRAATPRAQSPLSIHLLDQRINLVLAVAEITALDEMLELAGTETTGGVAQLEGPEKIGGLLEIGADSVDLVDEILHTDKTVLAQVVLDKLVIGQGDSLFVDLAVAALIDEVAHSLDRRETIRNVRLHHFEHFRRCFRQPHKDAIVDLQQAQQLEDLARFWCDFVDTR